MNPNDVYFDGMYKDIWKTIIPDDFTIRETDFLVKQFNLGPKSHVLDMMCGYGRHSILLAQQKINLHSIDNLKEYTADLAETAKEQALPIEVTHASILDCEFSREYDLAICMGNSLNFFPKKDIVELLTKIKIKSKGYLVINTWSLLEIACKEFVKRSWTEIDEIKFLSNSSFKFNPTRIETDTTMISTQRGIEKKLAVDYLYSLNELEEILTLADFSLESVFSIPGKKKFEYGDSRAYLIAKKN